MYIPESTQRLQGCVDASEPGCPFAWCVLTLIGKNLAGVNCSRRPNVESTTIESNETMTSHAPEALTVDLARVARERCGIPRPFKQMRHCLIRAVLPLRFLDQRALCVWGSLGSLGPHGATMRKSDQNWGQRACRLMPRASRVAI